MKYSICVSFVIAISTNFVVAFQSTTTLLKCKSSSSLTKTKTNLFESNNSFENEIVKDNIIHNRRAFLLSSAFAATTISLNKPTPANAAATTTPVDYKAVSNDVAALIKANPDWGPTLVRLAWHSSGTYDKMTNDGGSGPGTIRFKEELIHGGNAGLATTAVEWLEPIHTKYEKNGLSYADLYTLAGGKLQ